MRQTAFGEQNKMMVNHYYALKQGTWIYKQVYKSYKKSESHIIHIF